MRASRLAFVSLLALSTTACAATLIRGPGGWKEGWMPYSVTPLENGDLLPAGWTLEGFTQTKDGFRRDATASHDALDFDARRADDDASLELASVWLDKEDRAKHAEVLADRWIDRLVRHPKDGDSEVDRFVRAVPRVESTASTPAGFGTRRVTFLEGYDVQIDRREPVQVPGGEGVELALSLAVHGAPVERKLYLAVLKVPDAEKYLVVAYGNTVSQFDKELPDALSFAHRVHF